MYFCVAFLCILTVFKLSSLFQPIANASCDSLAQVFNLFVFLLLIGSLYFLLSFWFWYFVTYLARSFYATLFVKDAAYHIKYNDKGVIWWSRSQPSGTFRLDYEYEIEYEYDFSVLVFRLHIIMSHTHFIPRATLST